MQGSSDLCDQVPDNTYELKPKYHVNYWIYNSISKGLVNNIMKYNRRISDSHIKDIPSITLFTQQVDE